MESGVASASQSRVAHHVPVGASSIQAQPLLEGWGLYGHLQQLQQSLTIYPIDKVRLSHLENDYIDSPSVVSQQPPSYKGPSQELFSREGSHNQQQQQQQQQQQARCKGGPYHYQDTTTHPWISFSGRPSSVSSSSSSSSSGTSSDQQLVDHRAPPSTMDHQPPAGCLTSSTSKLFTSSTSISTSSKTKVLTTSTSSSTSSSIKYSNNTAKETSGQQRAALQLDPLPSSQAEKKHLRLCERCGRCRCSECTLPRLLPSCWVCNQEWLCSAQSLVDAATCMCLVRGVFYHCASEDQDEHEGDEGSCAERPCSCSGAHCCARWSFMAALSLLLPCLLCYLPATSTTLLGQRCYDRLSRPGCRCRSSSHVTSGGGLLLLRGGTLGGALEKQQQRRV